MVKPLLFAVALVGAGVFAVACAPNVDATSTGESTIHEADTLALPETNHYAIETPYGRMVVRLYDETPLHRDNFKRLVAQSFYDSTTFHRVISGFMIQGGDPNSRDDDPMNDGQGGPGYTVPAEFHPALFHKRGALATARTSDQVNPERASSGSQFYIVHGTVYDDDMLDTVEQQIRAATRNPDFTFSEEMRDVYKTEGGAPNLDQQYTVFGELVSGFPALDAIANAETPRNTGTDAPPQVADRPIYDIPMVVTPLPEFD